ncbi:protein aurora borealis isoform X1 [Gadus morhua]|uniref:Protein aurora borealis n=1 Tax=Gadus morhua TaxID=8049 RepID=A0A8C4ZRS7_GADMO|nr:protein aurora borealis isoform X1 [Gadus morhua]
MGDQIEVQITPETPGKHLIRNPFESPNDYHHLQELLGPSPSVFKHCKAKVTGGFDWAIEEMANLLPVDINPEDIQRQAVYLSQTMIDSEVEEKRQHAIEQFFTKGAIVPSPWAAPVSQKNTFIRNKTNCISPNIIEEPETLNVACQTTLSLPVAFDLEKILGDYYLSQDASEGVQECLSSSSLRRKLFLDGQDSHSGSDHSGTSSPERSPATGPMSTGVRAGSLGAPKVASSFLSSPLACDIMATTPSSTGQLSSSPVPNGRFRDHSLGSISPMFPDRSSPSGLFTPSVSPIGPRVSCTPIGSGERKQLSFLTPDGAAGVPVDMDIYSCSGSPYGEGCSPIRNCSPRKLPFHNQSHPSSGSRARARARCWASPPLSPILNPKLRNDPLASPPLVPMEFDPPSPAARDSPLCTGVAHSQRGAGEEEEVEEEEEEEEEAAGQETPIEGRLEDIMEREEAGEPSEQLTSSRMGNVSTTESSHMFMSLLAEGSSIRYDSSMQVDSGYNTTSVGTASLIDGLSSMSNGKESFSSNLPDEAFPFPRQSKSKNFNTHH